MATSSGITIVDSLSSSPVFSWSVGSNNALGNSGYYKYMVTVRANPNGSRIPTKNIAYRESGILTPRWEFTLAKNISSSGGPYRDYQVVVEAYDPSGQTSANNQIGSPESDTWHIHTDGYDLIQISNQRQTGIELSNSVPTRYSIGSSYGAITGKYASNQYMGPNGNISIEFISGSFDSDLVGGYLYISSGTFPKNETAARSGEWATAVRRVQFDFDPKVPYIMHPSAAIDIRGATIAYGSVSFYDAVDKILISSGINISTGLYMSHNAIFNAQATVSKLGLGGAYLYSVRIPSDGAYTTSSAQALASVPTNGQIIAVSNDPTALQSTVLYMGAPLTGSPFTGIYKGDSAVS